MVNNHSTTQTQASWSMTALNKSTFSLSVCLLAALSFSAPQSMANQNQGPAKEKIKKLTESQLDTFEDIVEELRVFYNIPGVAIAIVEGDEIAYAEGFGVRNLETQEPVTPNTRFKLNSITKAMTSTMVATLVDEHLLEWKQPVVEIMPSFTLPTEELTQNVQVRHLMEMNTGLVEDQKARFYNKYVDGISVQKLFDSLVTLPVMSEAGDDIFDPNGHLFAVAGFIAALASDTEYYDLMQERIFDPIGMKSALFTTNLPTVGGDYASGHFFNFVTTQTEKNFFPPVNHPGYEPADSISANALDIAHYLIMQLNKGIAFDGSRVVSVKNLMKTRQPRMEMTDPLAYIAYSLAQSPLHYGMGWVIAEQVNGVKMLVQSGRAQGFVSDMSFIQDADVGLVILTNQNYRSPLEPSAIYFLATVRASLFGLIYNNEPATTEKVKEVLDTYALQYEQSLYLIAMYRAMTQVNFTFEAVEDYLGNYEKDWYVELREGTLWQGIEVMEERLEYRLVLLPGNTYLMSNNGAFGGAIRFSINEEGITTLTSSIETLVKID